MATVLIVDDTASTRIAVRVVLEKRGGHRILEAVDGIDALRVLATEAVDAIVLDVSMPNLDGFGLLQRLGYPTPPAGTPPVFMHSAEPERYADRAQACGTVLHQKPANVLAGINALLGLPLP